MKLYFWLLLSVLLTLQVAVADVKIGDLPIGTASSVGANDSFPYVDVATNTTKRLRISQLILTPVLATPTFTGAVTAPVFVGALTGNATTATSLAANPTDCATGEFAYAIGANGNLTCAVPDATGDVFGPSSSTANGIALYNGTTGKLIKNSGVTVASDIVTATGFVGPLTGNVTGNVTGNLTGAVNGNVTGNLTGNVTGNVTGNLTGTVTGHSTLDLTIANNLSDVATPATAFNNISGMSALGDLIYGGASGIRSRLAGNTTATKKYLSQTGDGAASAAPSWLQPACGDLSNAATSCSTDATNATNIASGTLSTARLPALTGGDVTSSIGSGTLTIGANAVSNAKFRQSSGLSLVGRSANSTGDVADITASNDGEVLRRSGTSIGFGSVALSALPQLSAYNIYANNTGSTAVPTSTGLSSLMDSVFGSTQGSIIYRNNGAWVGLGPSTQAGWVLQSGGAAANPSWVAQSSSGGGGCVFAGSALWTQAASCAWSISQSAYTSDFTAYSDCTLPTIVGTGVAQPATKVPGIIVSAVDTSYYYVFMASGRFRESAGADVCGYLFTDGTDNSGTGGGMGTSISTSTRSGVIKFTTNNGAAHTVNIRSASTGGTACRLDNDNANYQLKIEVLKCPSQ